MKIFIQIIGLLGCAASIYSFQKNDHKKIITFQIIASFCFSVQYLLLKAYLIAVLKIIALLRSIVFFNHGKKWADSKLWVYGFCIAFIAFAALTYNSMPVEVNPLINFAFLENNKDVLNAIVHIFPICSMLINTFAFASTRPSVTRKSILLCAPFCISNAFISGSWGDVLTECIELGSTLTGIVRYDILKKKKA